MQAGTLIMATAKRRPLELGEAWQRPGALDRGGARSSMQAFNGYLMPSAAN